MNLSVDKGIAIDRDDVDIDEGMDREAGGNPDGTHYTPLNFFLLYHSEN